jgi:hypothetical protein
MIIFLEFIPFIIFLKFRTDQRFSPPSHTETHRSEGDGRRSSFAGPMTVYSPALYSGENGALDWLREYAPPKQSSRLPVRKVSGSLYAYIIGLVECIWCCGEMFLSFAVAVLLRNITYGFFRTWWWNEKVRICYILSWLCLMAADMLSVQASLLVSCFDIMFVVLWMLWSYARFFHFSTAAFCPELV